MSLIWHWHRLRAMGLAEIAGHIHRKAFPLTPPPPNLPLDQVQSLPVEWKSFGRLTIKADDPPRWNYDYLAGVEVSQDADYRNLPNGVDIKVIWELSRWYALLDLAKAGHKDKCIAWLEDWLRQNPPYRGLNWTSALESGMRLIHFTEMDVLLGGLGPLRQKILPAHVRFTWQRRSFGSSANNHLLGELAGLIVAIARWPQLESLAAPLDELRRDWEKQVLAQFAPDGGNREQALNYHAYSLELCQLTRSALKEISPAVEKRLALAEQFYELVQVPGERWDYGDSDHAGQRESHRRPEPDHWHHFPETGIARYRTGDWDLRWDLSPLGYLKTAAHGHLDALHLSIWWKGMAVVIDPGTGAYYGDAKLRNALASWDAHNGPHLPDQDFPKRLGPFLWSEHHAQPVWTAGRGEFKIPQGMFSRSVTRLENGWQVEDTFMPHRRFIVRWQFAPRAELSASGKNSWRFKRREACFDIQVSGASGQIGEAVVSPAFRQTARAPFLELKTGGEACVLRTIFLSC